MIETNYSIRLSAKPRPGTVKFVIRNVSDDGHDFWLKGGGKAWKTRVMGEAGTASLTAVLSRRRRRTDGAEAAVAPLVTAEATAVPAAATTDP